MDHHRLACQEATGWSKQEGLCWFALSEQHARHVQAHACNTGCKSEASASRSNNVDKRYVRECESAFTALTRNKLSTFSSMSDAVKARAWSKERTGSESNVTTCHGTAVTSALHFHLVAPLHPSNSGTQYSGRWSCQHIRRYTR